MGNIDIGSGGTSGKKPPKRKPPSINSLMTNSYSSGVSNSSPAPYRPGYTQPVISASSPVRRDPGPYSVAETAWGASGFSNSGRLAPVISQLRRRLGDEPALNSILSDLMTERYSAFQDRLDAKYDHQRTSYQRQLDEALDAQREGLPYDIPEKPKAGFISRGQNVNGLLRTLSQSLKPDMAEETKDAYTKFYSYELERLLDYKGDIRNQRNSLASYLDQYKNESQLLTTRESNDESGDVTVDDSDSGSSDSGTSGSLLVNPDKNTKPGSTSSVEPSGPSHDWSFLLPGKDDNSGTGMDSQGVLSRLKHGKGSSKIEDTYEEPGLLDWSRNNSIADSIPGFKEANGALFKILDEAADPLMWTMDKLSRPLYGVQNARMAYDALDEDVQSGTPWYVDAAKAAGTLIVGGPVGAGSLLSGKNPIDSVDEFFTSTDGPLEVGSEFLQGFFGKDKTLGAHVIAANAKRDPDKNLFDNHIYQMIAGLHSDIAVDPINAVGFGLFTKPINIVGKARVSAAENARLKGFSEEIAGLLDNAKPVYGPIEKPLSADEIFNLIVGKGVKATPAAKAQSIAQANARVENLFRRISEADFSENVDVASFQQVARGLRDQRESVLNDLESTTIVEALRRDLEIKVRRGLEPPKALEEFDYTLSTAYLEPRLVEAKQHFSWLEREAEKRFNARPSFEQIEVVNKGTKEVRGGKTASDYLMSGLTDEDTLSLADDAAVGGRNTFKVTKGGTKSKPGKQKSTAWQEVGKSYENKKSLWEKETNPAMKAARKKDLDTMRTKIEQTLAENPYRPLSESLPELLEDYRVSPAQVDNLIKDATQLSRDNAEWRRLDATAKKIWKDQVIGGKSAWDREAARTRHQAIARKANRILADNAIKIIKTSFEGSPLYKDAARVREIRNELRRLEKDFGSPETLADIEKQGSLTERMNALKEELNSLKGVKDPERESLMGIPEVFQDIDKTTGEAVFNINKLKSYIRIDTRKGTAQEINPFFGSFRISPTLVDKNPEAYNWLVKVKNVLQVYYEPHFDRLYQPIKDARREITSRGINLTQADHVRFNNEIRQAAQKAETQAFKDIEIDVANGKLRDTIYSDSVKLMRPLGARSTEKELIEALKLKYGEKQAALKIEQYAAKRTKNDDEIARIDAELTGLQERYAADVAVRKAIVEEARKTKTIMAKRFREEALLYAARLVVPAAEKQLSIRVLGNDLVIPHSEALFKGVEEMSGLPLIKQTRQAFADAFKSPRSTLDPEMRIVRDRALARTPIIVEHHINELKATLGQIPENDRIRAFDNMLKGHGAILGENNVQDAISGAFEPLLPWFNRGMSVGEHPITVHEINRYLPNEYKLNERYVDKSGGIDTVQKLIDAIRFGKEGSKVDRKLMRDPYRLAWNLRVATEQAAARAGVQHVINSTFGVKDLRYVKENTKDISGIIQEFRQLGWDTVPELGNSHLFPPEILPDIKKLLDMLEPKNLSEFGRMADRATGYWKTATTVYNPGYWTRNGIGEVMSSWFAGLNDPRYYGSAMDTIKYARGDGRELDALKSQFPMAGYLPSESVAGKKVALTLSDGTPITHEQVWVAYNDQALKTGFFNTEFDEQYSKLGNVMRQGSATQAAANVHTKMRNAGEWYEDYLRMAHFQFALRKSGAKDLESAAKFAAAEVRKYHFDYTDFTNFEKTVMLRAFPFYKWTRKALPLMTTMLFTKPGKVMAYPKVMNAAQNTLTTNDIAGDDNGFAPNYEGIVPGWIQDLWSYQIAGDPEEGDQTWFNVNTPQMDIYKNITSPGSSAYGLLNPFIKQPIEQLQGNFADEESGQTLAGLFRKADFPTDRDENGIPDSSMNIPLNTNDEEELSGRLASLMRTTPQGNFLQKLGLVEGETDQGSFEDVFAFLSGLGIYENNDDRRQGELMNRAN